jgi:hypothetical protein
MFLLDTIVGSEFAKDEVNPGVLRGLFRLPFEHLERVGR